MKSLLFHGVLVLALAACSQKGAGTDTAATDSTATTATTETTTGSTATDGTQPMTSATPATSAKSMNYENAIAELHTTAGQINLRFYPDVAPNHVKNFIELAQSGFYNGTKFHRVIPGFVIQGGDPNTKAGDPTTWGTGGSGKELAAEFSSKPHLRGTLSMARGTDPNSASSQFFICVARVASLDNGYTVFGEVTDGMDVVDKIVNAPTRGERPIDPVTITNVVVREARADEKKKE